MDGRDAAPRTIDYGGAPGEIYKDLRERILRGQLPSGSRIKIGAVAEEFGVSIIPVREALRMLEADHLIDILPRRSPVVSGVSAHEVLEISAIRLALEPLALAGAIPNMTGETLRRSREILKDYQNCSDPWDQVELNRKFHLILYEPCRKNRLMKIISDQYDGCRAVRRFWSSDRRRRSTKASWSTKNPESLRSRRRGKSHRGAPIPFAGIQ